MLMKRERELVVEYGKKLITSGLTTGTGGNISILDSDSGYYCISPSGIDYFKTTIDDIVVMDLDGNIVEGDRKPSSEYEMHRYIYLNFPEAKSVVHCHSTFATVLSTVREDLPASNYIIADGGGKDIKCADYATFGTVDIAKEAVKAMENRRGCLLANHGQITYGTKVETAFSLALTIEQLSKIHVLSMAIGEPVILSDKEMENILERFKTYGQKSRPK